MRRGQSNCLFLVAIFALNCGKAEREEGQWPSFLWYLGTYGPYDKKNRPYDKKNRLTFRKYLA